MKPVIVAVALLAGCHKSGDSATGGPSAGPSAGATSAGDFPDNPLLAYVPADTSYVFATFKPVSPEYMNKISSGFGPLWKRQFAKAGNADNPTFQALLAELQPLTVAHFEELGFSAKARMVIYGVANYPVFRIELGNGDKVFDLVGRVAKRANQTLEAPTVRGSWRYWEINDPNGKASALIAIGAKEAAVAIAPKATIDANLAQLLGEQKPAQALTTAQLKTVAERDHFTGQGVGYVDLARVATAVFAIAPPEIATADCKALVNTLVSKAPRVAIGADDLTTKHIGLGMVLELAPDVIALLKPVTGSLTGWDRALKDNPAMAMAFAGNIEAGKALLPGLSLLVRQVATKCVAPDLNATADQIDKAAAQPLPPFAAGIHGAYGALHDITMKDGKPDKVDGFLVLDMNNTADLIKMGAGQIPGFDLAADGKAHPLPAFSPVAGHLAANDKQISLALGPDSDKHAVDHLGGKSATAPLMIMQFDYSRLGDLAQMTGQPPDPDFKDVAAVISTGTLEAMLDDRGLVFWTSLELK